MHEHDRHELGDKAAGALSQENGIRTGLPEVNKIITRYLEHNVTRRAVAAQDEARWQRRNA